MMPLTIAVPALAEAVGALLTARNGFIVGGLVAAFKDEIFAAIYQVLEGDGMRGYITQKVNAKLQAHGLELEFRDVFDSDKSKDDVDKFTAKRVNAKAGTNFATLKNIGREAFLTEVSKVLAGRVNAETGANLAAIWPVDRLRNELATELARQFQPGVDLADGALFPRKKLELIQANIGKKMGVLNPSPLAQGGASGSYWGPPADDEAALRRAKARARAAKYRKTHRLVWVAK